MVKKTTTGVHDGSKYSVLKQAKHRALSHQQCQCQAMSQITGRQEWQETDTFDRLCPGRVSQREDRMSWMGDWGPAENEMFLAARSVPYKQLVDGRGREGMLPRSLQ